jgi:nucleoside-diphosphate-sugar epimerase
MEGRFRVAVAGLEDAAAVEAAAFTGMAEPYDVLLHVAHIRHTPVLMRLAESHAVRRVVLVHTTGMYSRFQEYGARYREIDSAILSRPADATPPWTILRPTMIYGNAAPNRASGRDHNLHRVILALARWPIFPVIGARALFQPVHVDDVAAAVVAVAGCAACGGQAFDISGATVASYGEILTTIAELLDRRPILMPVPMGAAEAAVMLGERLTRGRVPITVEQIRRLQEDKVFDHNSATTAFGFRPRGLRDGIAEEIARLRSAGLLGPASNAVRQVSRSPEIVSIHDD